jgi:hypothetical protein
MGRANEYERTLLRAAELLADQASPAVVAFMCRLVVEGMNLEAAESYAKLTSPQTQA